HHPGRERPGARQRRVSAAVLLHPAGPAGRCPGGYVRRDRRHLEMDPMSRKPRYDLDFSVPRGWIQLPVLENKNELRDDRKLRAWASTRARQMLGTGAAPDQLDRRTQELATLT